MEYEERYNDKSNANVDAEIVQTAVNQDVP